MRINPIVLNRRKIVLMYIFAYPVCDIIFTLMEQSGISLPISPNQIIRGCGLFLFFLMIKNTNHWIKTMLISVWSLCSLMIQLEFFYSGSIITDLSFCLKYIQNFIFLFAFVRLFKDGIINIDDVINCLIWSSYIVSASILCSYLGLGNASYAGSSTRFGVKGFFSIQTTITAYLMLIMPLYFIKFKKNLSWQMIICVIALFSIGSKTGVLGTILEIILISLYDIRSNRDKNNIIRYSVIFFLCITIFPVFVIQYIEYLVELYTAHAYYYDIMAFILSNRNDQIYAVENEIEMIGNELKLSLGFIFGYGYSSINYMLSGYHYETIERDFHGGYYCFGVISICLLSYYLTKVLLRALNNNIEMSFKNRYMYISMLILCVGVVYGWLGGHVFYEAMNQLPFWIIAAYVYSYKNTNITNGNIKI